MFFSSWLQNRYTKPRTSRRATSTFRPQLEVLEGREVPSTFYAATASDLIADINAANKAGGANTIVLTAPTSSPYVLTAANNGTDGGSVLPVISGGVKKKIAADNLTILTENGSTSPGYGDTIDASKAGRLFDVASGGSLTLQNVTLQNGLEIFGNGGAIYNQGTLALSQVMVLHNAAAGPTEFSGAGGGIWSNGSLTVENSIFENNVAYGNYPASGSGAAFGGAISIASGTASITGSAFGDPNGFQGNMAEGATAYGGAVYVAAGTVTMSGDSFGTLGPQVGHYGNSAVAGYNSSSLGDAYGGAVYVAGGSVTFTNDSIQGNYVENLNNSDGWAFGDYGGWGGGIYISSGATAYIDSFTVGNTTNNLADPGGEGDIWGPYHLLP